MLKRFSLPVALTIAGSDSGGGAGIQADLKAFAALGVHGASVITCVTAQNPRQVLGIENCQPAIIRQQLKAVFAELPPKAVKTGMLYSPETIRVLAAFFRRAGCVPLVIDPVIVSTSGRRLLKREAVRCLVEHLFPLASLITPNLHEAAALTGHRLTSVEDMRQAAKEIYRRFRCAALIKGGHLRKAREAVDIFFDGKDEWLLSAPLVRGLRTHGTGCAYSAAVTAHLASGLPLPAAVARAKEYVSQAIADSKRVGKHFVLGF